MRYSRAGIYRHGNFRDHRPYADVESNQVYVNIGEIVLGVLVLLIGVFGLQGSGNNRGEKLSSKQMQVNFEQQRKDYELLRMESKQQMQGYFDMQRRDYEQIREENRQLREDYIQQMKASFDLLRKDYESLREENIQQRKDIGQQKQVNLEHQKEENESQKEVNAQQKKEIEPLIKTNNKLIIENSKKKQTILSRFKNWFARLKKGK